MVPSQPLLLQQQLLEWQNHALLILTSCVMGSNSTTDGPMGCANHTSKTFVNRKAGHIASATLANQQGGVYIRIPRQKPPKPPTVCNIRCALAAHTVNDTADNNI
jgi:hypothetical protein